ncbi:MAG: AAA family ATPase [Chloroflexi bacterium]|nr:AAA family ATPase [Chloroflexota bacterium]
MMVPYWPFQEIIRRYAGITEEDSEHTAWTKLERRITTLFPEKVAEVLPYLASLLALGVRGEFENRVKYLDGEAMGHQIFLTSRRFFERLALEQPVVLIFEDLHWADESSALLLEHLLQLVERAPLLICGISRPYRKTPVVRLQEVADQNFPERYTRIQLVPLSQTDSAQLVRNMLMIENLPSRVREMIVRKAEGNPFFLEEIIRTLIDTGAVMHDPTTGRWQATAQIETVAIPDTVQGVIMARVDRLDEDVKQALRTASVVGRSFFYRVLRAVAEVDRQLDHHMVELQAVEFIREKRRLPELEYIFKHALAQEATYESILLQKRRELHGQVGQAIEMLFADRLDEFYGLLAYHYARAEKWEKAQEYLFKAGDQAGRVAADAEALTYYEQALAAYTHAFGDEWDPVEQAALERKIGEALFRRGKHQQAVDHFQQGLACLGRPFPTSRWGVWLAILREIIQQIGHRMLPKLFLKSLGGPVSPAVEEECLIYWPMVWIAMFTNLKHTALITIRSLNVAERGGFAFTASVGCGVLGLMLDIIHVSWLAEIYNRRAVALAEQIQNPRILGIVYGYLATHKQYLGKPNAAVEYFQHSSRINRELGDLHSWGIATTQLVYFLANHGNLTQALIHSQDVVRLGQEGDDLQVVCWGLRAQGMVLRCLGQLDEAIKVLKESIELAETIPDYSSRISAGGQLGGCHLCQGELEQALSTLQASQQVYVEYSSTGTTGIGVVNYCIGLARVYLAAAEQSGTIERSDWLKKAQRACQITLKQCKVFRSTLPEAMRLQGTYEWLRGYPAAAQKWWQRSLVLAEKQERHYELGITYAEMGQRLGDRAHLECAESIFAKIGAEWDLARAREWLGQEE